VVRRAGARFALGHGAPFPLPGGERATRLQASGAWGLGVCRDGRRAPSPGQLRWLDLSPLGRGVSSSPPRLRVSAWTLAVPVPGRRRAASPGSPLSRARQSGAVRRAGACAAGFEAQPLSYSPIPRYRPVGSFQSWVRQSCVRCAHGWSLQKTAGVPLPRRGLFPAPAEPL